MAESKKVVVPTQKSTQMGGGTRNGCPKGEVSRVKGGKNVCVPAPK